MPQDEGLVHDDIGGDDIDTAQSRLVTADGYGERLGWERLEFLLALDLDDWTSVSKWRAEWRGRPTALDRAGGEGEIARVGEIARASVPVGGMEREQDHAT